MGHIICTSDLHINAASPRWAECQRVLTWIADYVCREDVDLVIVAGDLYDRASTPVERAFAAGWVTRLASACPVVIVRGNHDAHRDLAILAALEAAHPIHVAEEPQVIVDASVVVQCLPWPRTAELAKHGLAGQALDEVAREALRDVLRGLAAEADLHIDDEAMPRMPRVLATHALITGAVTSHGQPLVGGELAIGLADLALAGADVVVAGHIHAPQAWTYGETQMLYCGSPFRTAFGEHETKSIVRIDTDGAAPRVTRVETPAQQLHDVIANVVEDDYSIDDVPLGDTRMVFAHDGHRLDLAGSQVRLRYVIEAAHREFARAEAAKLRAEFLAAGAERVVVEPEVVATSTARAPEIARATSVRAQLETLWVARGDRPADADAVLLGLAVIEAEVM